MVIIAACSSSAHQLLDLLSDRYALLGDTALPYRAASSLSARYSASAARLSGPAARSARGNARLRRASSKHSGLGCRYAPRPGSRACGSGWTSSPAATRRSRLDLTARSLQPTQVLAGSCCSVWTAIPPTSLPRSDITGTAAAPGPPHSGTPAAGPASSGAASDLMSIRQPVSRAASLAFWPSLPIASDS